MLANRIIGLARGNEDTFDSNTISSYTQSSISPATWSISGGELTASGGNQSVLIRNGTSYSNVKIEADINKAYDAGLVVRFIDINNYYVLALCDDSGQGPSTNLRFRKWVGGAETTIASANVTWPTGTPKTIRFEASGTSFSASVDGVQVISASDSSHAGPGGVGLRNHAGGSGAVLQAFRWDV